MYWKIHHWFLTYVIMLWSDLFSEEKAKRIFVALLY